MSLVTVGRLGGSQGDREQRKQSRDCFHFLLYPRHTVTRSRRQQGGGREEERGQGPGGGLGNGINIGD